MSRIAVGNWSVETDCKNPCIIYKGGRDGYEIDLSRLRENDWTYQLAEKKIYTAAEMEDFIKLLHIIDSQGLAEVNPQNFSLDNPH